MVILPWLTNRKPPRIFKTHGLYEYAPYGIRQGKCKIVVQTRNPKSTYLSWYKALKDSAFVYFPDLTWEDFFAAVISGESKHLVLSSWFDFYLAWWKHRDHLDVYFLNYEAMFKDGRRVAKELADFFGRTLTEEQIAKILKYIDFEECKKNPAFSNVFKSMTAIKCTPGHMRKGKIDDWKNHFTVAESEQFDKLYEEKMEGSGFPEPVYE
ncbi:unnamed protein product [Owenia fusiformis]|uniref:Uncharacterized protein n=1 Tax=Owenia fusiformis TaxID=6347 RepID=A0A8J1U124_OWEFU|nr:unnamed protein product [Owenia fusiformis]